MKREGHEFCPNLQMRCKKCNLTIEDYDMLKEHNPKRKLPCPYVSEVLPSSTDTRVNR